MVQRHLGASGILVVMVFFKHGAYSIFSALISPCLLANKDRGRVAAAGTLQSNCKSSKEYSSFLYFFIFRSRSVGFLGAHSEEMIKVRLKAFSPNRTLYCKVSSATPHRAQNLKKCRAFYVAAPRRLSRCFKGKQSLPWFRQNAKVEE